MTPTCLCHMGTARGQVFLVSLIVWSRRFRPLPSWFVVTAVGRNCYSPVDYGQPVGYEALRALAQVRWERHIGTETGYRHGLRMQRRSRRKSNL